MFAARNMMFAGVFNPLSLSPALWLSDTGSDTAQWDDLSGNGRHATQSDSARRPSIVTNAINGRQVRRFDGDNDSMSTASLVIPQPYTSICVFIPTITTSISIVLKGGTGTGGVNMLVHRSGAQTSGINAGNAFLPFATSTNLQIFGSLGNGANSVVYRNGAASDIGNAGTNQINGVGVGVSRLESDFFNGDIAEILVFPAALSTADRQAVERYLAAKWNITLA